MSLAPLLFVPACYLIAALVSAAFLPEHALILRGGDFLLQLAFGFFLVSLSRRIVLCVVAQLVLILTLYVGNAVKISFLGGPLLPSDIHSADALVRILEPGMQALVLGGPVVFVCLVLWNFRLPRTRVEALVVGSAPLLVCLALLVKPGWTVAAVDRAYATRKWDQLWNYESMGATTFLGQAYARAELEARPAPDQPTVRAAVRRLRARSQPTFVDRSFAARNVYLLVLESFWDASVLEAAHLSRDPIHPAFRKLWDAGGRSTTLSPAFAGGTANAEFELLCGMPSTFIQGVPFESALSNDVPCLPRVLTELGYSTFAAHANVPAFWNRATAYRRLGFESLSFIDDFDATDSNGRFLSDKAFLRQSLKHLDRETRGPRFAHLLTISSHWPYPLNESRPAKVRSKSSERSVRTFANSLWYASLETARTITAILRKDPDALILAMGDHPPYLGENFAGYAESGVLASSWSDFTAEMFLRSVRTPLVVIDGDRGSIPVGTLPMFAVPGLILDLLGHRSPTTMDAFRRPPHGAVRPFSRGPILRLTGDGTWELCTPDSREGSCQAAVAWVEDARILWEDLLRGSEYTYREILDRPRLPAYIAHAGGGIDGRRYTNSREALDETYGRGFRVFEVDFSWTADGRLALAHDWDRSYLRHFVDAGETAPTEAEFLAMKRHDGLTPMALAQLLDWLGDHPDASIVTDVKDRNIEGLSAIAEAAGDLRDRFIPQIYHRSEFEAARALGFDDVIFTLYRSDATDDEVVAFAGENELLAVTLPDWRARKSTIAWRLGHVGTPTYAHTVNDPEKARRLRARGVTGLYTDHLPTADQPQS